MTNINNLTHISGILFDLDGVLYIGSKRIAGSLEAINIVRNSGKKCRFITNTSTLSRESLQQKLRKLGFNIMLEEIISAPQAAKIYLQQFADPVCHLLLADDVKRDFYTFRQSVNHADFVIIGDIGDAWSYIMLNDVFNLLINGAELIAIHEGWIFLLSVSFSLSVITILHYFLL